MWIESHTAIGRHPKTRKLCRLLGASLPQVVGHLHLFWHWVLEFAEDGRLDGLTAEDIADAAYWDGDPERFVVALLEAGFLDESDGTLVVHDWRDYAGRLLADRERKRARRAAGDTQAVATRSAEHSATDDGVSAEGPRKVRGHSADDPQTVRANRNRNRTVPTGDIRSSPPSGAQTDAAGCASASSSPQWELWLAHCDALGLVSPEDPNGPPFPNERERRKQLSIAAQLVREQYVPEDVAGCTRWLAATRGIRTPDLARVKAEIASWVMGSRPQPPARASPGKSANGKSSSLEIALETLARIRGTRHDATRDS